MQHTLDRFIRAQEKDYDRAFAEVLAGRKQSHWMWYIFPQIQGLGFSETSKHYAIENLSEAEAYLKHPVLGPRLLALCNALLQQQAKNARQIFGSPDDMKLKSSMTLFAAVPGANPVFQEVLNAFFKGEKDTKTVQFLKANSR